LTRFTTIPHLGHFPVGIMANSPSGGCNLRKERLLPINDQKVDRLRRTCKKLMVDVDLDKLGAQKILAERLGMNRNSLCMALTGYRKGLAEYQLLQRLKAHLRSLKKAA